MRLVAKYKNITFLKNASEFLIGLLIEGCKEETMAALSRWLI
jgi:hypothetical protein